MRQLPLTQYPKEQLEFLLSGISFIRTLKEDNPLEAELILGASHLYEADPGEQITTRGSQVDTLYFLLRGQLLVYPDEDVEDIAPVSIVSPGQVIGALELAADQPATGSVAVDETVGRALLLGVEHAVLGRGVMPGLIHPETKVSLLRLIANNARWRVDQYRSRYPDCPHASRMGEIPIALAQTQTNKQIESLVLQCTVIADLLRDWKNWLRQQDDDIPILRDFDNG
ncbi:cyclic nucleotide-binding domain-containing protein [Salinibius halmophilus]|uniref:cyclic nucleotide-binding domain-containing protein n=1 Tax=Salinibius halmophilus TaxID=1853216 RepID=UPI000E66E606|nr:cyclic nucleotide-binding domain-containing protein [Salinibius halmophilus]